MHKAKILLSIVGFTVLSLNSQAFAYQPPLSSNVVYSLPSHISTVRYELSLEEKLNNNPSLDPLNDYAMLLAVERDSIFAISRKSNLVFIQKNGMRELGLLGEFIPSKFLRNSLDIEKVFIKGVLIANRQIFVSFVYDDNTLKCGRLALVSMSRNYENSSTLGIDPKIIFKSACDKASNSMWGGSLASDGSSLFLAIGDNRIDWKSGRPFSEFYSKGELISEATDFGKVLFWELAKLKLNLKPKVYARGFRNPLGMAAVTINKEKRIVLSDFGPEGGDELNVLKLGNDYGWPKYSLGRVYDVRNPSINSDENTRWGNFHSGGSPLWSWVSSANPTQIIQIPKNSVFGDWNGQLLVATLSGKIERMILDKWRVIGVESIWIGTRMRSIVVTDGGEIWVSTDDGKIFTLQMSL